MSTFPKLAGLFSVFALALLGLHLSYVYFFIPTDAQSYKFVAGYVFLYILTVGLFGMVTWMRTYDEKKMGMAFLVGSGLKMLLSLLFILILVYNQVPNYYGLAMQFMIPYMLFLVFEVVFVLKLLNKSNE
ncbi:MAG: hypothetical protein LAT76_07980 [Schleiferiaceae bacterium]|nr:hypothetical protein [Schleiferiaceae bacterium]